MDDSKLVRFLNLGKSIYVDGNNVGLDNDKTEFYKMTGCALGGWGSPFKDNITTLTGQSNIITPGKQYAFISGVSTNASLDYIKSDGGKILFTCQDNRGRGITYEGPNGNYRLLYLTFMFGGIRGPEKKNELMQLFMKYLLGTTSLTGTPENAATGNRNTMRIIPGAAGGCGRVIVTLSAPSWVRLHLYSITGRRIGVIAENHLVQGTNEFSLPPGALQNKGNGLFYFWLKANNETRSQPFAITE